MALACPQCKQVFEKSGVCPQCNVILLYHAQNLQAEPTPAAKVEDEPSQWQQTPWGRIVIGLILAQGLNFGLQQLATAGILVTGDGSDVWGTLWGLVLYHTVLGIALLMGGALSGAGQQRGMVYGGMVGLTSGIISLFWQNRSSESFTSVLIYAEPMMHLATGALGGALGMLIWRPTPTIPELENSSPSGLGISGLGLSFGNAFAGPVYLGRVCAGAFVVVIGVVWAEAIFSFLMRASHVATTSKLQAQLVSMEISALVALLGASFAGATTRNSLKQGLCVGFAASAIVLGVQINNPNFSLETAALTDLGIIAISSVGGWFGGQLFPPYDHHKRRRSAYS